MSFTEEAQNSIIAMYREALSDIQTATKDMTQALNDLCNRTRYNPLKKYTNDAIGYYNDTLSSIIKKQFEGWKDSEASLKSFSNLMEAGSDAENTAKSLENNLFDEIESMFAMKMDECTVDTSEVDISEEHFIILKEIIEKYVRTIQDYSDEYKNKIDLAEDENKTAGCIRPVIVATFDLVTAAFSEMARMVEGGVEEFVNKLSRNVNNSETETVAMSQKATQEGSNFANFTSIFKA